METFAFIVIYLVGSVLSYGLTFGVLQNNYPTLAEGEYSEDVLAGLFTGLGSYAGVLVVLFVTLLKDNKLYFKLY